MKWIKASERLWEYGKPVIVRYEDSVTVEKAHNITWCLPIDKIEWLDESASLPSSSVTGESEKERKVILLTSYCGDNPNCTDDLPCEECLKMCNVAIVKDSDIKKVIAGFDFMRDTASLPVTGESEAIGFAEWTHRDDCPFIYNKHDGVWYQYADMFEMTTLDLFKYYKQSK